MKPFISIIIPTFNRVYIIGQTLDSIIDQTYPNWECIVIDDGSTDYTNELMEYYLEKEGRIQYYQRPNDRPKGANACRNYGFEKSRGEFIHWFDSDDLMAKDNLQVKVDYLLSNEDCDFCISKVIKFEGNYKEGKFTYSDANLKINSNLYEEYITGKISILNVNPLWRRRVFNPKELYDETLFQFQDLHFYSRLIFYNERVGIINKELIYIRRNNESISTKNQQFDLNVESFLKVKHTILERTPLNPVIVVYIIRDILWAMRWNMAKRNYSKANHCLSLCLSKKKQLPKNLRFKLLRVSFFFNVFRILRKGDTKFKSLLKI